jgi:serine/threonine protein kinase
MFQPFDRIKTNFESLEISNINEINFADAEQIKFNPNEFRIDKKLGNGQYVVHKCVYLNKDREIAVKMIPIRKSKRRINPGNKRQEKKIKNEVDILRMMKGEENIISFYGVGIDKGNAWLCMELMDRTLTDIIIFLNMGIDSSDVGYIIFLEILAYSVAQGLIACKHKNILHSDIKPANILISKNGFIKISDFGEAFIVKDNETLTIGTMLYCHPKKLEYPSHESITSYDFWSLAIILLEILYGYNPILYFSGVRDLKLQLAKFQDFMKNLNSDDLIRFDNLPIYHKLTKFIKNILKDRVSEYEDLIPLIRDKNAKENERLIINQFHKELYERYEVSMTSFIYLYNTRPPSLLINKISSYFDRPNLFFKDSY